MPEPAQLPIEIRFQDLEAKLAAVEKQIAAGLAKSTDDGMKQAGAVVDKHGGKLKDKLTDIFGRDPKGDLFKAALLLGQSFDSAAGSAVDLAKKIALGFAGGGLAGVALGGVEFAVQKIAESFKESGEEARKAAEKSAKHADEECEALERLKGEIREAQAESRALDLVRTEGLSISAARLKAAREDVLIDKEAFQGRLRALREEKEGLVANIALAEERREELARSEFGWRSMNREQMEAAAKEEQGINAFVSKSKVRIAQISEEQKTITESGEYARLRSQEELAGIKARNAAEEDALDSDKKRSDTRIKADAKIRESNDRTWADILRAEKAALTDEVDFLEDQQERKIRALQDSAEKSLVLFGREAMGRTGALGFEEPAFGGFDAEDEARRAEQLQAQAARDAGKEAAKGLREEAQAAKEADQALDRYIDTVQNVAQPALGWLTQSLADNIGEWARYSKAQEEAAEASAISAEEAENNESARLQAVLAGIAEESITQAAFEAAQAIASYARYDYPAGVQHTAAAVAFGAIGGGTAAGAHGLGESRGETTQEREARESRVGRSGSYGGGSSSGSGGGVTVVVNTGGYLYSTAAEMNEALAEGVRRAEKLR